MASVVFVQFAAPQTKFSVRGKSLRNPGSMQKMSLHPFVDLEKACNRVPQDELWRMMQKKGIVGHLLIAIKSLHCQPEVSVNGNQSKLFHVDVGLRQGCVLSPLLFIIYMIWIDKLSRTDECVTIARCKISRLLFADDLVLLASSESGMQHALNGIATA